MSGTALKRKLTDVSQVYGVKKSKVSSLKRSQTVSSLVKKALARVAEKKELNTDAAAFAMYNAGGTPNTTGSLIFLLNPVVEGTDYNNRVGLSITHKYLNVSVSITQSGFQDWGFYAIVLDRQPNGALPLGSDIYDNSSTPYSNLGYASRNTHLWSDRFQVVMHQDFKVGANSGGAEPWFMRHYVDLSKLRGRDARTKFSGTGGSIGNISEGSLLFFISTGANNNAGGASVVNVGTKYRFTDV